MDNITLAAALRAAANVLDPANAATSNLPGTLAAPAAAPALAAPAAAPALAAPAAAAPANVTSDQLTSLIMPHIANEAIKAALGVAMRNNGVANLPEAQPHQYGTLYAAFQQVLAQFGIGGAAPAAAPAAAATSII